MRWYNNNGTLLEKHFANAQFYFFWVRDVQLLNYIATKSFSIYSYMYVCMHDYK